MRRRQAQCAHVHTLSASAATTSASAGSGDRARRSAVAPAAPRYLGDGVAGRGAAAAGTTPPAFGAAGRPLPLVMIITTTFATWFGSETVLGIPAKFVQGGLKAVDELRRAAERSAEH